MLLRKTMFGTRDAARNWAEGYGRTLLKLGFMRGVKNPCLFHHPSHDISLLVHFVDFLWEGNRWSSGWLAVVKTAPLKKQTQQF